MILVQGRIDNLNACRHYCDVTASQTIKKWYLFWFWPPRVMLAKTKSTIHMLAILIVTTQSHRRLNGDTCLDFQLRRWYLLRPNRQFKRSPILLWRHNVAEDVTGDICLDFQLRRRYLLRPNQQFKRLPSILWRRRRRKNWYLHGFSAPEVILAKAKSITQPLADLTVT